MLPPFHHLRPVLQSFSCSVDTQPVLCHKQKEERQSSRFAQDLSRPGALVTLSPFLFFLFVFQPRHEKACNPSFRLLPPTASSVLNFILLIIFLFLFLPLLFLPLLLNSPPFHLFFEGSCVLSLAVCFGCTMVPPWLFPSKVLGSLPWRFLFSFSSSGSLNRSPFTSHPKHPLPSGVDSGSSMKVFFAHPLLYLTSLLLRIQMHPEYEEDRAPNCSLGCLPCTRLKLTTPTADWLCLTLVRLHYSSFLHLFLASAPGSLPFLCAFGTWPQLDSSPRR